VTTIAEVLSLTILGLAIGSVYALMALAINVLFSARRIINFAQGDLTMLAGLLAVALISRWGLPYLATLAVTILVAAGLALVIERIAIRPLPVDENDVSWILAMVAVAIIVANVSQLIFGTVPFDFPTLFSHHPVEIAGVRTAPAQLLAIAFTAVFMFALLWVQNHTIYGKAMKAAACDADMAAMLGIGVKRYVAVAFATSGALAAVTAFLVGPMTFVTPDLGFSLGIKGFAAAALGGLGTFSGAVAGGLILGLVETLSGAYLGSIVKDSVSLIILCLILIFRPTGLVGEVRATKV
jgi:branched-chain amino acid transport system permease protein